MLSQAQQNDATRAVNSLIRQANEIFCTSMVEPEVTFDLKGACGGRAWSNWKIQLNAGLMVDNWDEYINNVIPHEVAHLVDQHLYGHQYKGGRRVSHGKTWKHIMRALGAEPSRTHSMDVSKVSKPKTKYLYACSCCGAEVPVGPKYHKDIQQGRNLFHKPCKGSKLIYKDVLGKVTWREAAQKESEPKKAAPKPSTPRTAKKGTQIAHAIVIYKEMAKTTTNRQDIIKAIMHSMQVNLQKASGLHDRAKKKIAG